MKKKINIIIIFLFSLSFQAQVCSDLPEIASTSSTICVGQTSSLSININSQDIYSCTGTSSLNYLNFTPITNSGIFTNIIKNNNSYFLRSDNDVLFSNSLTGPYTSLNFNNEIAINLAAELLGIDNLNRLHVATGHNGLFIYDGANWSSGGLSGFGTSGQYFTKLSNGRILITKSGSLRGIYYSDNNGSNWTKATTVDVDWNNITVASNGDLYASSGIGGVGTSGVVKSTDNGSTWTYINTILGISTSTGIFKDCEDDLYIVGDRKIFKSTDLGSNWVQITTLPTLISTLPSYGEFIVASNNDFYYIGDNKLYFSSNEGNNWVEITSISGQIRKIKEIDGNIVVCSTQGVFVKTLTNTATYLWSTGEISSSIIVSPTSTSNYWVDISSGSLTCRKNITINVTPTTTPAFNQIEPICSGAALNPLPTTSNNGITGTWSPALNNTTTTTYTFSPDSGQCANATTTRLEVLNCNTNCCINLSTLSTNQTLLNTYYPAQTSQTITPSSSFINLDAVPSTDIYGNSFGDTPIKAGDLLLIIQMQGANFNSSNSTLYGAGIANFGLDNLGATGFTDIENTGIYEYVIALNDVPLSGGRLEINGSCNGGLKNTYQNISATANSVIKRFQVIRVPKFQNLKLSNNIETTAWNGTVGGVIAFIVTDELDLNGFTINASGRGFRGGFQNVRTSGNNNNTVRTNSNLISSGKGEGISGTPRFMWNGVNAIDYGISWIGYKDGDYGRGAPGNAGGGGNTHNAGGGGGGNGGFGGVGANGVVGFGGSSSFPIGGRMGSFIPFQSNRIFLGGGGGGGDANNATTGVKGGPGGGVIILQSKTIKGNGQIIANGLAGEPGVFFGAPDGAGGGGAGGSILILTREPSPTASISIEIKGGKGGNTLNDLNDSHGPGGGGGGGIIMHNIQGANLNIITSGGNNGLTGNGTGVSHGASSGQNGTIFQLNQNNIPDQVNDLFPSPKSYFIAANTCQGEIFKPINQSNVSNLRSSLLVSYIWNFGDGSTSSTINPTHVYSKPGNYEVSLEVRTNWGCIDKFSQIISVAPSILPIFSQINAICSGESLTPLPNTSTNGIIGSWSPSLNNEATTTYTFTPDAGQCALNTTMTINVNPKTIPSLFTPIAAICSGETLTPLTTTSTNGIIGSWSPPLNNEATTTYTFTPDAGQCALNTSLTVEVKVIPIPTLGTKQIFCTKPLPTIAQLNAIGSAIKWYNSANAVNSLSLSTPLIQGQAYFASQTIDGCESVQRVEKNVDIINCDVVIFNSIKVDAEPMSDRLYIDDISYFPNNSIQIFNRYGRLVWETKGYNNDSNAFKGKANVPDLFQKDEQLPAGTYFYILNYFNFIDRTQKEKNGYLQLFNGN